jgi:hypothetical protein
MSKLFEITVKRGAMTWDEPRARAQDEEGVLAAVKEAMEKPFLNIEIEDVSWWNGPGTTSVTLLENCPRLDKHG